MPNTKASGSKSTTAKTKKTAPSKNTGSNGKNDPYKIDEGILSTLKKNLSRLTISKPKPSLKTLFEEELKDMYSAEKQLADALPKMAKAAENAELKAAFNHHLQQTKKHAERLESVFKQLHLDIKEKKCEAMEGLCKEGDEVLEEYEKGALRDAAMIIGAQKIEHYEIASYGSLAELADVLGYHKVADVLERTLKEEEETDHLLTEIAREVNDDACDMADLETKKNKAKRN